MKGVFFKIISTDALVWFNYDTKMCVCIDMPPVNYTLAGLHLLPCKAAVSIVESDHLSTIYEQLKVRIARGEKLPFGKIQEVLEPSKTSIEILYVL